MSDAAAHIDSIQRELQESVMQRDIDTMRMHYGLLETVSSTEPLSSSTRGRSGFKPDQRPRPQAPPPTRPPLDASATPPQALGDVAHQPPPQAPLPAAPDAHQEAPMNAVHDSIQPARALPHWDDEDDIRLDLEDDEPRTLPATATWLPLLAVYILAIIFWLPAARLACWAVLWACYALGSEPTPPAPYTFWAP